MVYISIIDSYIDIIEINSVPYQLEEIIGSGSFGIVIKARDIYTDEIFAVKILIIPSTLSEKKTEEYINRIALEITAMNQFKHHPNVVKLHDYSYGMITKDTLAYYLVMDYCEFDFRKYLDAKLVGESKERMEKKKSILKEDEIQYWANQLISCLMELQKFQFMHRDLKMENMLLKRIKPEEEKKKKDEMNVKKVSNSKRGRKSKESEVLDNLYLTLTTTNVKDVMESFFQTAKESSFKARKTPKKLKDDDDDDDDDGVPSYSLVVGKEKKKELEDINSYDYKNFQLKLCDFGLAKRLSDNANELTNTVCGSLTNMAPEILNSKSYSYGSDIWSVGIILLEMVNGEKTSVYKYLNMSDYTKFGEKALQREMDNFNVEKFLKGWEVNDLLVNLLERVLDKSTRTRISFSDLIRHPFLRVQDKEMDESTVGFDTESKIEEKNEEEEEEEGEKKEGEEEKEKEKEGEEKKDDKNPEEEELKIYKFVFKKGVDEMKRVDMINTSKSAEVNLNVLLSRGKYSITFLNKKKSKWNCYKINLQDITKETLNPSLRPMYQEISFEKNNFNNKYVEKRERTVEFHVREHKIVTESVLEVKLTPSWWSSYWKKQVPYEISVKKI